MTPHNSTINPSPEPGFKTNLAICVALVIAVFAVFGQVVHHDFISVDDDMYVYKNLPVARGLTWEGVGWAFSHGHAANWHPLTWLSHMLDCQLYGLHPGGHHFTNVLLHAANVVLLFLVLRRMTGLRRDGVQAHTPASELSGVSDSNPFVAASATQAGAAWPSAFVAGLFALHPLRVESVAWVAERKDVLSGLFFMLTLWAYVRYAAARSWSRYTVVILCFALGLMAKPMLVTLPFVLLLLDYWPLQRFSLGAPEADETQTERGVGRQRFGQLIVEKIPMLALAIASSALTIWAQRQVGAMKTAADLELPWRLANAAVSYVVYIGQMVFPHRLAAYYPHPGHGLPMIEILGAVFVLMVTMVAIVFWGRRFAFLPVGWFWYLGMLVPVIGLVQVGAQSHADRYTYLPQIGLYVIVAWGLAEVSRRWSHAARLKLATAGVVGLAILTVCIWRQTRYWANSEVLWQHALVCNPGSSWIEKALADVLSDQGKLDEAMVHYQRGAQIAPNYAGLRLNFGNALYRKSQFDEARQEFEAALRVDPEMADAHISLGAVLYLQGKIELAIQHYQKVLARNPSNAAALSNLGVALEGLGRIDEAITHYRQAASVHPPSTNAHRNLARVLLGRGQAAEAVPHYEQALKASPNDVNLRSDLADALARAGQFERAIAELSQTLSGLGPGQEAVAQKFRNRLEAYQAGRLEPPKP